MNEDDKRVEIQGGRGPGLIEWLEVKWVLPGAGSFGRDKAVPRPQATAANVSYRLDGQLHEAAVSLDKADELIRQTTAAGTAAQQTARDQAAGWEAERQRVLRLLQELSCPICQSRDFEQQLSREDSQWGFTSLRMRLLICRRCQYVLHFSRGSSVFDFD
jgi:uncharacterized protein